MTPHESLDAFIDDWRQWVTNVLHVGVAHVGRRTAVRVEDWADRAETLGWIEDAALARRVISGGGPLTERADAFVTSLSRLELASTLRSTVSNQQEVQE
ncbi:MAG: hypothetical protein AAF493_00190 [Pseudomonadota bacterium]